MIDSIEVLNAGEVSLIEHFGDDLSVVNAARVSFASYDDELTDKSVGLINYLVKNKHATPFEHVVFKFHVKAPIFVAREWFRHRWSSFNEMSMRYHVPKFLDFYIPEYEVFRRQVGKPGAYTFEHIDNKDSYKELVSKFNSIYVMAEDAYYDLLNKGVAKEIARSILPVGQYTEFVWTVNLRSLFNFLSLRNSEHAQYEIAEYARVIEDMIASIVPSCHKAFLENDRIAL